MKAIRKKIDENWGKFLVFNVTFIIVLFLFIRTEFVGGLIIGISGYSLFIEIFLSSLNPFDKIYLLFGFIWSLIFYNVWFYFLSNSNRKLRIKSWIIFGVYFALLFIITFFWGITHITLD